MQILINCVISISTKPKVKAINATLLLNTKISKQIIGQLRQDCYPLSTKTIRFKSRADKVVYTASV